MDFFFWRGCCFIRWQTDEPCSRFVEKPKGHNRNFFGGRQNTQILCELRFWALSYSAQPERKYKSRKSEAQNTVPSLITLWPFGHLGNKSFWVGIRLSDLNPHSWGFLRSISGSGALGTEWNWELTKLSPEAGQMEDAALTTRQRLNSVWYDSCMFFRLQSYAQSHVHSPRSRPHCSQWYLPTRPAYCWTVSPAMQWCSWSIWHLGQII